MSFSRSQQPEFRRLVRAAFAASALPAAQQRAWYEAELLACVGVSSTVPLDRGRDYDVAMAHFEALADNGQTTWQHRAETGDHRRICHAVFGPAESWAIDGVPVTSAYLSGIARQALQLDHSPALRTLDKPSLAAVVRSLSIHLRRRRR